MKEFYLPNEIEAFIKDMELNEDTEGLSKAKVIQCTDKDKTYFLKMQTSDIESAREYNMYRWVQGKLPVPKIVCYTVENGMDYLLLEKADGEMLESSKYKSNPVLFVKLAAQGIRVLQSVKIETCEFDSTIDTILKKAKTVVDSGVIQKIDESIYTRGLTSGEEVYQYLVEHKPQEEIVFIHGDYCFNNYFSDGEKITGFIDLGRAGKGDLYQDIALCVRELRNYDYKYTELLFDELGIKPDFEKIKYYILLDELF